MTLVAISFYCLEFFGLWFFSLSDYIFKFLFIASVFPRISSMLEENLLAPFPCTYSFERLDNATFVHFLLLPCKRCIVLYTKLDTLHSKGCREFFWSHGAGSFLQVCDYRKWRRLWQLSRHPARWEAAFTLSGCVFAATTASLWFCVCMCSCVISVCTASCSDIDTIV